MLYKVTPMMAPPEKAAKKERQPGEPRKKRKSAVYDHEGHEVLITLMCLKCRSIKPLAQFGLRKMADGAIRNQPWCRPCRSGAGVPKPKVERAAEVETAEIEIEPDAPAQIAAPPTADPLPLSQEPAAAAPAEAPAPQADPAPVGATPA
ncbi:MAG TPA: hypothetical protein VND93_19295 [Myxococcales bacterium]|nr:hypothetical protein [Myxococcales bacterium]